MITNFYRTFLIPNSRKVYAPHYYEKEMLYQDSLVSMLSPDSPFHHYWKAENQYRRHQYDAAEASYKKALENIPINIRLYAQITYGLALVYEKRGDREQYEHYLIRSAISDQVCPLKENLALQTLAQFIFKNKKGEVERANRYLNYAMEDAMFYNNRLRLLQLAKKFPDIVFSYQEQNRIKNQHLQWAVIVISLLALLFPSSTFTGKSANCVSVGRHWRR